MITTLPYLARHLATMVDRTDLDRLTPQVVTEGEVWDVLSYEHSETLGYRFRVMRGATSGTVGWVSSDQIMSVVSVHGSDGA